MLYTSLLTFFAHNNVVWWTRAYRIKGVLYPSYINNCLKVKHLLCICQLCSSRYTIKQIKNCMKSTSVTKAVTMNKCKGSHRVQPPNWHFCCQQRWMEYNGGHWLVHKECIVCTVVCQKVHFGLKWCRTVKNQARSVSCYWVILGWRHQSGNWF